MSISVALTTLSFCSAALSALSTLIVAVRVGPSDFGTQASAIGLATLGAVLLDCGLTTVVQRTEAHTPGGSRDMLGRRYALCGAIVGMAVLLTLLLGPLAGLTLGYAVVLATSLASNAALRGARRFGLAGLVAVLDKGSAIIAAIVLVGISPDLALLEAFALGTTVQVLVTALILHPPVTSARQPRLFLRDITSGRHFLGTSLLNESQRLDVPIVHGISGAAAAGIFAAPARITALLGIPAGALASILLTRLSSGSKGAARETRIVAAILVIGHLVIGTGIAVVAAPLTKLALGADYSASAPLLIVYGFAMLPAAINQLASTVLAARRKEHLTFRRVAVTVPTSLALVAVGSRLFGELGATAGFAIGQSFLCLLLAPLAYKALKLPHPGRPD